MKQKILTFTVPCFNSEEYMSKAIKSILPGGDRVEIIIVDDGSTDNTASIADKFAGVYGYGPEQGSALMKMESYRSKAAKFVDKLPGGKERNKKYDQLWTDYTNYDEHPHYIQRINEEIKVLEFELKKGCDPKYAEIIKSQIAQLKQLIKDASTVMKEFNEDEKAKALYNAYINNKEPLAVDEELEDEINNALDAVLN